MLPFQVDQALNSLEGAVEDFVLAYIDPLTGVVKYSSSKSINRRQRDLIVTRDFVANFQEAIDFNRRKRLRNEAGGSSSIRDCAQLADSTMQMMSRTTRGV